MALLSTPLDKLIDLLQQHLSLEDVLVIADDYEERSRHDEKNYSVKRNKSLSERLVEKAGDAHEARLLVLHAMHHKDIMGLLQLIFEYRPDLQQPVQALGFENTSLIRAYLVALLKEQSGGKTGGAEPLASRYRIREAAGVWSEVSLDAFLGQRTRVILRGATAPVRTMTLQRLLKRLAAGWRAARTTAPFPVFADMRRWYNARMSLLQFLQVQMSWLGVPQLAEQLPDMLREGRAVLLLDGLDELPYSKRSEITGLRDDPRIRSIAALSEEKIGHNTTWVLSCQVKDFLIGPQWHDLYVIDPAFKDAPIVEDTPSSLLQAHIEQALERAVGGDVAEANELRTRLGYLALNMTYPELQRGRPGLFDEKRQGVEKQLASAWLFHLRALRSNNQKEYIEPETSLTELQQADSLLQQAEAAGLLVRSDGELLFAHQNIQHYFIIRYCLTQSLDDPRFLERVSNYEFRDIWPLWRAFEPALIEKLLALLQSSKDSQLRRNVVYILGYCNDIRAVNPLIAALKDEDEDVRRSAAFALGELGDLHAIEALIAAYDDPDVRVRGEALHALDKIASEDNQVTNLFIRALADEEVFVRYTAGFIVRNMRDGRLIEPLVALLADANSRQAKEALIGFGKAAVPALMVALIDTSVGSQYRRRDPGDPYAGEGRGEASYNAAEVLGEIGDIRPLPLLVWLLEHDHEVGYAYYEAKVRHAADEAIKKIQNLNQRATPLVAALQSNDPATHIGAAFALGLLGDQRAVEPLLQALQHENKRIRWGAADLLGRLGDARAIEPLLTALTDEEYSIASSAADALHKFGELALSPLIAALGNENSDIRGWAARLLGRLRNKQAVEPLIAVLSDEASWVRRQAISALGMLRDRQALEPLLALASDPDSEVRRWLPHAVDEIDPDRAVDLLIVALKDQDEELRYLAANDLCSMGNSRAVDPLIAALKDKSRLVREYAGYALRRLGDERAVEPLIENLDDEFLLASQSAAKALGTLGESRAIEPLIAKLPHEEQNYCSAVAQALVQLGTPVTPYLLAALEDQGPDAHFYSHTAHYGNWGTRVSEVRIAHLHYYAADVLGKVGDTRALPLLLWMGENDKNETVYGSERVQDAASEAVKSIRQRHQDAVQLAAALDDQDTSVRVGAAFALGLAGEKRATEPLITALTDPDRRVRWAAVHLLGELGERQAVPALISALKDRDKDVRTTAVTALTRIGPAAAEALIAACKEVHEWPFYTWVAYTLGQIGKASKTVRQLLLAALEDQNGDVRYWIARAVGFTEDQEMIEPLKALLQEEDLAVQLSAASALVLLGNTEMRELVYAGLKHTDPGVRFAAIENILATPDTQATEPLIAVLQDENRDLRSWAVMALDRMGDKRALPALERLAGIPRSSSNTGEFFPRQSWWPVKRKPRSPWQQDAAEPAQDEVGQRWELAEEASRASAQADTPEDREKLVVEVSEVKRSGAEDNDDIFVDWMQPFLEEPVEESAPEEQVDDELRELAKRAIERVKQRWA